MDGTVSSRSVDVWHGRHHQIGRSTSSLRRHFCVLSPGSRRNLAVQRCDRGRCYRHASPSQRQGRIATAHALALTCPFRACGTRAATSPAGQGRANKQCPLPPGGDCSYCGPIYWGPAWAIPVRSPPREPPPQPSQESKLGNSNGSRLENRLLLARPRCCGSRE